MRTDALTVLLIASLGQVAFAADPPTLEALEKTATQLASPLARERSAGETWLDANAAVPFAELARLIEHGDAKQQPRAAITAAVFLSPWARAVMQGTLHKGQIALFQPRRPTARPVDHPQAAIIRRAALAALKKTKVAEDDHVGRALCNCLAEVADADAADQVAALLVDEPDRYRAGHLMGALDTYYGLPRSFDGGGLCGLSTPEEIRQFNLAETKRCNESRGALLTWHKQHKSESLPHRIDAALDVWDKLFAGKEYHYYTEFGDWAPQLHFGNLIRLGEAAIAALRRRPAGTDKSWHHAPYEIALGAITGQVDKPFVEKLFQGSSFEQTLACEIIAAAGNRDFKDQLAAMVQRQGPYKKASFTLAVVYRGEAIPILQKAWKDDFIASCAIAELRLWGE